MVIFNGIKIIDEGGVDFVIELLNTGTSNSGNLFSGSYCWYLCDGDSLGVGSRSYTINTMKKLFYFYHDQDMQVKNVPCHDLYI